jgi:hypothetical protein
MPDAVNRLAGAVASRLVQFPMQRPTVARTTISTTISDVMPGGCAKVAPRLRSRPTRPNTVTMLPTSSPVTA